MFQLRYVTSELRRRAGRTILTALGLAAGVGLVIGIIGVSQGLSNAQTKVLSPLQKVGTDILVTRVAGATTASATQATTTTTADPNGRRQGGGGLAQCTGGGGGGGFFAGGPGGPNGGNGGGNAQASQLNQADCSALLNDNDTVLTDLSKLGPAGTKFEHDFFLPATLLTFPDAAVSDISKMSGVASATPGLTLIAQHESGTVPNQVVSVTQAQQTITQTERPAPMTDAERQAFQTCLESKGATFGGGGGNNSTAPTTKNPSGNGATAPAPDGGGGGGGGFRRFDNSAFTSCMPARFQQYETQVVIPARQIQQIVNPPQTDTSNSSYTAAGIDPNSPKAGLVTASQVTSGRFINPGANNEVLVSVAYANKKSLKAGSTLSINGQTFNIVGVVDPALTGSTADVYFTVAKLQELSSKTGRVNQVLVKATSASQVDKVAAEISKALPGAQVVTAKDLSSQVTGSLADAKKLADRLGGALAAIVLAAVFVIAMLLTLSSVAKRVREIGTLRAIGWSKGSVVRQIVIETMCIGLLGGIFGVLIGFGVSGLVHVFSPALNATTAGVPSFGSSSLSAAFGAAARTADVTQTVHLTAPVTIATLLIGVGFAVFGGLLAGAVGGWRAARLSPAEALRNVG